MTQRTIRLVDVYGKAAVRQMMIDADKRDGLDNTDSAIKRDKIIVRLRKIMGNLTEYEKDWIRRKIEANRLTETRTSLADEFRKLGVEPNWEA